MMIVVNWILKTILKSFRNQVSANSSLYSGCMFFPCENTLISFDIAIFPLQYFQRERRENTWEKTLSAAKLMVSKAAHSYFKCVFVF